MRNSGDLLAGIISNEDPETASMGVTIPELQQFLLGLNAKHALALGAGKDNRLYFSSEEIKQIADPDYRPATPSGILMLASEKNS